MTPVFILAAGRGSRLRPLTDWLPKPLLPVGDRPALGHILDRVRPVAGPLVANAHYRLPDLRTFLAVSAPDVQLSEEAHLLGTAGGLAHASGLLGPGAVLVWNGDILSSLDPEALVNAHAGREDAEATLAVRSRPAGEGNVGTDARGCVVRLRRETVASGEISGGDFLGIHVVGEALRSHLPTEGCLVGDVYLPALRAGQTLRVFEDPDIMWHDIGTLADYEAANFAWLGARGKRSLRAKPMDGLGTRRPRRPRSSFRSGSFVSPDATVSPGVTLQSCIVGAGAHVEGNGLVDHCIVWPGARVTAPCASTVVTPMGRVPLRE